MVTEPIILGQAGGLRLVLRWRDDYGTVGPVGMTWGDLQIWIDDTLVWGTLDATARSEGIRWSWIELLEFLSTAWPYLVEEEQYPIEFEHEFDAPRHLGELQGKATLRWRTLTEEQADLEDELLRDFLSVHDLAEALQGAYPPSLLLLRQGQRILAATKCYAWDLPFESTMATLKELGSLIAERIVDLKDARSELARKRWVERNAITPLARLSIATGQDAQRLHDIWPLDLNQDAANDSLYGLKAAARMIGGIGTEQAKTILAAVQSIPTGSPPNLGTLGRDAADLIQEYASEQAAAQGYRLADLLREHLGNSSGRIDPERILESWGTRIQEIQFPDSGIDAVAVWGSRRRATILVNTQGPRAKLPAGKRSTLAHEICHLLIDRDGALPAAEVLGGKVPPHIEQRANAFAAELLLPRANAGAYIQKTLGYVYQRDARDQLIEKAISDLAEQYGVSHELASWQALRSGAIKSEDKPVLNKKLKSVHSPF